MYGSGNLDRGSVSTLERWGGEGDGRDFQKGEDICITGLSKGRGYMYNYG